MSLRLIPLPAGRFDDWRSQSRDRLIRHGQESGLRPGYDAVVHADAFFAELLPDGVESESARIRVIEVTGSGSEIGVVWLVLLGRKAYVIDLAFAETPTDEHLAELFELVVETAREHPAATLSMDLFPHDVDGWRFVDGRGFRSSSIQMILDPLPEREIGGSVEVTRMTAERYVSFAEHSEAAFADDLEATGRFTAEEAVEESRRQFVKDLPQGLDTPDQELFVASADGEEVGILWFSIRLRGEQKHAFILDVEVHESQRRKGYGREIMQLAEREARRCGAHSVGLHVFGENKAAVTLYEQLGYRRLDELLLLDL